MRTHWGSKLGFILATTGSAIGLGNIWRFPYLAGQYGGGVFLLTYLCCVIFLGYFLLSAKLTFGRIAQTNLVDGFRVVGEKANISVSRFWGYIGGGLGFINALLVAAVYVVVIGWTASYVWNGGLLLFGFSDISIDEHLFQKLTSSFSQQLFWGIFCITLTVFVIIKGVKQGIERVSLWLMPILFFLLIFMVIWMIFLPNSGKGILFFLTPDWTRAGFTTNGFQINQFADLLLAAFGQAVYSLSLGMGVAFIYGSYLSTNSNIKSSTRWIVFLDTLVAFLSGLIVLPAVFSFGLEPNQGPALSFISLPLIFSKMTAGTFLMFLFFVLLFLAALTSLISIYEAIVSLMIDKFHYSRLKSTVIMGVLNTLFSTVVLLSFTKTVDFTILGQDLFTFTDKLTGSYTMLIMVFFCCLFMGWKISDILIQNIGLGSQKHQSKLFKIYFRWTLRLTAPVVMFILFITACL